MSGTRETTPTKNGRLSSNGTTPTGCDAGEKRPSAGLTPGSATTYQPRQFGRRLVTARWRQRGGWGPLWLVRAWAVPLPAIDLLFLAANLTKLPHGAWLPLAIGIVVFIVLVTWQHGPRAGHPGPRARRGAAPSVRGPAATSRKPPLTRVPGTA